MFEIISGIIDFILRIDVHLAEIISRYGITTYGILFSIIFAETGFVITPFEHIIQTKKFFEKHGGKTIFLARFVPIVRTFAPFVAGIGKMHYGYFITYNLIGGISWILLFTLAGYFFGNIPAVQHNFTLVILAIIILSVLPMVYHYFQGKKINNKNLA
ncbi:MAG: hypothetical protein US60_C0036G0005 [Microgenomates group bacterium GW2011_GWC1_37_8]|nr:MAG: hypothetical protein US60_C0036G0005 [Microgenomates group bacterium GW2011_GWC1_37_8]